MRSPRPASSSSPSTNAVSRAPTTNRYRRCPHAQHQPPVEALPEQQHLGAVAQHVEEGREPQASSNGRNEAAMGI